MLLQQGHYSAALYKSVLLSYYYYYYYYYRNVSATQLIDCDQSYCE